MNLAPEHPQTATSGWLNHYQGYASPDYEFGPSSSNDFGTIKTNQLRHKIVELSGYRILMSLTETVVERHQTRPKVAPTMTIDLATDHPDLERAESRLLYLADLDLTESFEDLSTPSEEVIREAGALLRKFAAIGPECGLPDLGMDSDGTIVFSFHPERCGVIGSLSVFGDGTYSYCIEKDGSSVENGAARISGPIAAELQNFLVR